jgi:hypothetical protein
MQVDYYTKYLKYKQKYLDLKEEMIGSGLNKQKAMTKTDAKDKLQARCKKMTPERITKIITHLEKKGVFTGPSIDEAIKKINCDV